jgi:hypothetical protein
MDQYYCVKNNQEPYVRIINIEVVHGFQTFHGLQWSDSLAFLLFHGFDTDYRPMTHQCATCSRFSQDHTQEQQGH